MTTSQLLLVLITVTWTSISPPLRLLLLTSPSNVDRTNTAAGSSADFLPSQIDLIIMINVVSYFLLFCDILFYYFVVWDVSKRRGGVDVYLTG